MMEVGYEFGLAASGVSRTEMNQRILPNMTYEADELVNW